MVPYFVFFSGAIGVGKSSIMMGFKIMLNKKSYFTVKEYIDYQPKIGEALLKMNKEGNLSDYEFQNYILDCYEAQLTKIRNEEIVLFERHPMEALGVFVKGMRAKMTDEEKNEIENRILFMLEKFQIPDLRECYVDRYNTSIFSIKSVIDDLNIKLNDHYPFAEKEQKYGEICYLTACVSDMVKRVELRGRVSEKNINGSFLAMVAQSYEDFFKRINIIN